MNQEQRKTYSEEFQRINRKLETKFFPRIHKAIKAKTSSLIILIREVGMEAARRQLETDLANAALSEAVRKLYIEVGLRHARKEYRRQRAEIRAEGRAWKSSSRLLVKKAVGFGLRGEVSTSAAFQTKAALGFSEQWTTFILQYLSEFLLEKITYEVNRTTREKLLEVLQEGIADGWGIEKMVEKLESLPFTRSQAARITRTEINRAANVGTMAAVDTSEYEMNKHWVAALDQRTRGANPKDHADHYHLNGQEVPFEGKFRDPRSGEELDFPGDPEASASQTVNCRCSAAPVARRDDNGRLIPKPQPAVMAPVFGLVLPPMAARPQVGVRV